MSVYKEDMYAIKSLMESSVRIFGDAADMGIIDTPNNRKSVVAVINHLKELTGGSTSTVDMLDGSFYKKFNCFLCADFDSDYRLYRGYDIEICWFPKTRKSPAYFSVDYNYTSKNTL